MLLLIQNNTCWLAQKKWYELPIFALKAVCIYFEAVGNQDSKIHTCESKVLTEMRLKKSHTGTTSFLSQQVPLAPISTKNLACELLHLELSL